MKKKIVTALLTLCMILTFMPAYTGTAFAANWFDVESGGILFNYGANNYLSITMPTTEYGYSYGKENIQLGNNERDLPESGWTWAVQKNAADSKYDFKLILNKFNITHTGGYDSLMFKCNLEVELRGSNNITTNGGSALAGGLDSNDALANLALSGDGSLTLSGTEAGISCQQDVSILGGNITAKATSTSKSFGVMCGGNINITNGVFTAQGHTKAISQWNTDRDEVLISNGTASASTEYDGANRVTYVPANNNDYKWFKTGPIYSVATSDDGHGTVKSNVDSAMEGSKVTLTATPALGYQFKAWQVISNNVTITNNSFTMPTEDVSIKGIFEAEKYKVTEGSGQTATSGQSKALTFKFDGPLELLSKVSINDEELEADNYAASSGSTIITLNKDYVSKLAAGNYTLKATYTNGSEASATFSLEKKAPVVTPTDPDSGDDTPASSDNTPISDDNTPTTNDASDIGLWVLALILTAGTTTAVYRKKINK